MSTGAANPRRLLVIVSEAISEWIGKGEVVPRYFNPGDLFDRVDLILTNDDRPDASAVRAMVGDAEIGVHNLPTGESFFRRTWGYHPAQLRRWARGAVELAAEIEPDLVRCYGANLNAFAAAEIKRILGIPYLVSLHINPDVDVRPHMRGLGPRVRSTALARIERGALRDADLVLPVYRSIVPFLERIGVSRYEVAYNMLAPNRLARKREYPIEGDAAIISVGRQIQQKRPVDLIRAVARTPGAQLTLIGDGPDHEMLRETARATGAADRFHFERAVPNEELCQRLPEFDLFATHSEYYELSKAVLEALIAGLPVLLNRRTGDPIPEVDDEIALLVESSTEGYESGLQRLLGDDALRKRLGTAAADRAAHEWVPEVTEPRFVEIYRDLLGEVVADPQGVPDGH